MDRISYFLWYFSVGEPLFWCLAVSAFVFAGAVVVRRRLRRSRAIQTIKEIDFESADAWLPPAEVVDDRRSSIRREDGLVEVQVAHSQKPAKIIEGFVVNRSKEGVRLALKASFPSGCTLEIRAANAPEETPWTKVTVRNCEQLGDYYKLGCQFNEKLPWNVLLLFG